MTNSVTISKEFGNLADMRASDPVTIANAIKAKNRLTDVSVDNVGLRKQSTKI